jgi:ATP-dependent DNA helicase RecG
MEIMCSTNDGFKIAEDDMQMRGPGDLYGTKQSGILKFRLADILIDKDILEETRTEALEVIKEDPNIENPQNELLRQLLKENDYQSHWSKIS